MGKGGGPTHLCDTTGPAHLRDTGAAAPKEHKKALLAIRGPDPWRQRPRNAGSQPGTISGPARHHFRPARYHFKANPAPFQGQPGTISRPARHHLRANPA